MLRIQGWFTKAAFELCPCPVKTGGGLTVLELDWQPLGFQAERNTLAFFYKSPGLESMLQQLQQTDCMLAQSVLCG